MSRKHNTKHTGRGKSRYPERLAKRGVGSPRMDDLATLRRRAQAAVPKPILAEWDYQPARRP